MCDCDECVVCDVQFVVPRKHSPKLFDSTEVTLYNIPSFVQFLIIFPRLFSVAFRRNDRTHSARNRLGSTGISFIRLIHCQGRACGNRLRHLRHQLLTDRIVRRITRRQTMRDRQINIGNNGVNLGRQAAATLADRLRTFFLGAPVPSG